MRLADGTTLLIGEPTVVDAAAAVAIAAGLTPRTSRLIVGVAMWALDQILGEIEMGHWGLCRASGSDLQREEAELWRCCWEERQPLTAETVERSMTLW